MTTGLMQDSPLLISAILEHAAVAHRSREIVSRLVDEPIWRYTYAGASVRVKKAARAFERLGVKPGDRVSTLAWNTHRHFELFYAIPGIQGILHTANPRLSDEHIAFTINHAGSSILLFDKSFLPLVQRLRDALTGIHTFIVLSKNAVLLDDATRAESYDTLISSENAAFEWPRFDESAASFLCYTSGTTGNPKGVLYSHRSVVLHALAAGLSGALGFSAFDCIMPCQSLYHATGWGLPFIAAINGCKLVLPCEKMDARSLQELIKSEGVTFSGGVPTIWKGYLDHLEKTGEDSGTLQRLLVGGSAVPRDMATRLDSKYGVTVRQIWGMTETSPLGVVSTPTPALTARGEAASQDAIWSRQGRLQFGIELKIVDDSGMDLPHDGHASGALLVRGPWVIERYYKSSTSAVDEHGWFDTGDVGTIDQDGFLKLTDRKKDLIKSGGEWISSIDVENAAAGFPGAKTVAVVGIAHPKWDERPLMIVEALPGVSISAAEVLAFLQPRVVKWWLPDDIVFAEVPLTSVGKIDKKAIREQYSAHYMQGP